MADTNDYPYTELIDQNIEIDGFPFYAESITPNETYSRHDVTRTKILNGAEVVTRGDYIPRDFTFTSKLQIDPEHHDMYDDVFQELVNKPCQVVCRDMGGMFDAQVIIKKSPTTGDPRTITCEVQVVEICNPEDYFPDFTTNTEIISITSGATSKEDLATVTSSNKSDTEKTSTDEDE